MNSDHLQVKQYVNELISDVASLQLATLNNNQTINISYTPFICVEDETHIFFYIFISELAQHTQNLKQDSKLSILLIEDESKAKNIFARKRLSLECKSKYIERSNKIFIDVIERFKQAHGKTVELLESLPDFHLYQLSALSGSYVHGFGNAHKLSGKNLTEVEQQTGL